MSEPINTALIGFGKAGQFLHAPFIEESILFEFKKIVERTPKGAGQAYPNVQVVKTYNDILLDQTIELIVIATPNDTHASMIEQALLHGKHVVVDKPFTVRIEDAKRLQALSIQAGKHIFVYQNRRWDSDFLTIQKILKEKILGEIISIESRFDRYRPEPRTTYWKESAEFGNGLWYDLGPHLMDQAFHLFGQPLSYKADIKRQREGAVGIDYFDVQFAYEKLTYTIHAGMLVKEPTSRWLIVGSEATFIKVGVDPQEARLNAGEMPQGADWGIEQEESYGLIVYSTNESKLYQSINGDYRKFYEGVFDSIRNDAPALIKLDDAVELVGWLERLALE